MTKELKPANQHPDFGKVCLHGQLKRKCYVCELEEEIGRMESGIKDVIRYLNHWNSGDKHSHFISNCEDILQSLISKPMMNGNKLIQVMDEK